MHTFSRSIIAILLLSTLGPATGTVAAHDGPHGPEPMLDLTGATARVQSPPGAQVTLLKSGPEEVRLQIINEDTLRSSVQLGDWFDVERAQQVVLWWGSAPLMELTKSTWDQSTRPAINRSTDPATFQIMLPAGDKELRLVRDVAPPTVNLTDAENLSHNSFVIRIESPEPVWARLDIKGADGAALESVSPQVAYQHTFPVQGLSPETEYQLQFLVTDLGANVALLQAPNVTTSRAPPVQAPTIAILEPQGADPSDPIERIVATAYLADGSPADTIYLFVNKQPVTAKSIRGEGTLTYLPVPPLGPGNYLISVEAYGPGGEWVIEQMEVRVADADAKTPMAGWIVILAVALVMQVARRRQMLG